MSLEHPTQSSPMSASVSCNCSQNPEEYLNQQQSKSSYCLEEKQEALLQKELHEISPAESSISRLCIDEKEIIINIQGFQFIPRSVCVRQGTRVRWIVKPSTNASVSASLVPQYYSSVYESSGPRFFVVSLAALDEESDPIHENEEFSLTMQSVGRFEVACSNYMRMKAEVIVVDTHMSVSEIIVMLQQNQQSQNNEATKNNQQLMMKQVDEIKCAKERKNSDKQVKSVAKIEARRVDVNSYEEETEENQKIVDDFMQQIKVQIQAEKDIIAKRKAKKSDHYLPLYKEDDKKKEEDDEEEDVVVLLAKKDMQLRSAHAKEDQVVVVQPQIVDAISPKSELIIRSRALVVDSTSKQKKKNFRSSSSSSSGEWRMNKRQQSYTAIDGYESDYITAAATRKRYAVAGASNSNDDSLAKAQLSSNVENNSSSFKLTAALQQWKRLKAKLLVQRRLIVIHAARRENDGGQSECNEASDLEDQEQLKEEEDDDKDGNAGDDDQQEQSSFYYSKDGDDDDDDDEEEGEDDEEHIYDDDDENREGTWDVEYDSNQVILEEDASALKSKDNSVHVEVKRHKRKLNEVVEENQKKSKKRIRQKSSLTSSSRQLNRKSISMQTQSSQCECAHPTCKSLVKQSSSITCARPPSAATSATSSVISKIKSSSIAESNLKSPAQSILTTAESSKYSDTTKNFSQKGDFELEAGELQDRSYGVPLYRGRHSHKRRASTDQTRCHGHDDSDTRSIKSLKNEPISLGGQQQQQGIINNVSSQLQSSQQQQQLLPQQVQHTDNDKSDNEEDEQDRTLKLLDFDRFVAKVEGNQSGLKEFFSIQPKLNMEECHSNETVKAKSLAITSQLSSAFAIKGMLEMSKMDVFVNLFISLKQQSKGFEVDNWLDDDGDDIEDY